MKEENLSNKLRKIRRILDRPLLCRIGVRNVEGRDEIDLMAIDIGAESEGGHTESAEEGREEEQVIGYIG